MQADATLDTDQIDELRRWVATHRANAASDDPIVVFVIPVICRAAAVDWPLVCENLARTIASLRSQVDPGWRAYICCQDNPDGITFDDQVRFLKYDETRSAGKPETYHVNGQGFVFDKIFKVDQIWETLASEKDRDGYLYRLDADDLAHPELVSHIRSDNNGIGYLVDKGYMWNGAGDIAPLLPEDEKQLGTVLRSMLRSLARKLGLTSRYDTGRLPFYFHSGSCAAIRFDTRGTDEPLAPDPLTIHHRLIGKSFDAAGTPIARIPFPAMVYLVGQSTNMHAVRGKADRKGRYLRRYRCSDAETKAAKTLFGLK